MSVLSARTLNQSLTSSQRLHALTLALGNRSVWLGLGRTVQMLVKTKPLHNQGRSQSGTSMEIVGPSTADPTTR